MIDDAPAPLQTYPCSQIFYRAATDRKWIRPDGTVRKQAFNRRRPPRDRRGLSGSPDMEHRRDGLTFPTHGTVTLHVGRVRDLNLGVDIAPDSLTHGNIIGLPDRDDDNATHDFLANKLAALARGLPEPNESRETDHEISN